MIETKEVPKKDPKPRRIKIIQTKTFCFKPNRFLLFFKRPITAVQIDLEVNQWLYTASVAGQNPMPAKAFSNHKTGEVFVCMAYMQDIELPPTPPDPATNN